jgi:tRNA G18 (ribose-2'-O)-methylase SpoU
VEDIFQMHNTSAVMRSCEIFGIQLNVIEQRYGKSIDKEIHGPKNGLTLIPMIVLQLA